MHKVLLMGEALIDQFTENGKVLAKVGGAPLNVAAAITKFGVTAEFVGSIGDDEYGNKIKELMQQNNVGSTGLITTNDKTTVANVTIDSEGERSFTFERGADENLNYSDIPQALINESKIYHFGSATAFMGGSLWESYSNLLENSQDKIVVFDPNYRDALYNERKEDFINKSRDFISKSDIVKLSLEELILIAGIDNQDQAIEYILTLGPKYVLITLGSKGTSLSTKEETIIIPSVKVKQIDTTGAGDSFIGYVVGQLALSDKDINDFSLEDIKSIIREANICASIVVGRKGAFESIPSIAEVKKISEENPWN